MLPDATDTIERVGSQSDRRRVRIYVDGPPSLKRRLETLAFESGIPVTEIARYAFWEAVLAAEGNMKKFCERVARQKLVHREQERMR